MEGLFGGFAVDEVNAEEDGEEADDVWDSELFVVEEAPHDCYGGDEIGDGGGEDGVGDFEHFVEEHEGYCGSEHTKNDDIIKAGEGGTSCGEALGEIGIEEVDG